MNVGLRGHQFVKEGAEEVLELIASFAPRMEQAASQIQDSRDLYLPLIVARHQRQILLFTRAYL